MAKNMKTRHMGLWNDTVYIEGKGYAVEDMGLVRNVDEGHAAAWLRMPGWSEWTGPLPDEKKRQAVTTAPAPVAQPAAAAPASSASEPFPETDVADIPLPRVGRGGKRNKGRSS